MAQLKEVIVEENTRFIGKTYAQTPPVNTNDTQIATTEFVITAINNALQSQ